MDKLWKVLLVQFAIFLCYSIYWGSASGELLIIMEAFYMFAHIVGTVLIGLIFLNATESKEWGKAILWSALWLLVIGFPSCILIFN